MWYKVFSIILRAVYRYVQMLVSIVFLLPLWQSSPTRVYFDWKPAVRIAAICASIPFIVQLSYLLSCQSYVPEADITLCNPPLDDDIPGDKTPQQWVYDTTRSCNSIWVWLSVDCYEIIYFLIMLIIQLLLQREKRFTLCVNQV